MEDEIDIEEHDILEHPQVKAAFPDLSKIQIEVHTSGGLFLDTPTHLEDGLLDERQDYSDNEFKDETEDNLSKTAQPGIEDPMEDFGENGDMIDNISDSESHYDATQGVTELVSSDIVVQEVDSNFQSIENKVDEVQDELIDNSQYGVDNNLNDKTEDAILDEFVSSEIDELNNTYENDNSPEPVESVQIISDDEMECQGSTEMVENDEKFIEEAAISDVDEDLANEESAENENEFIDKALEYTNEFTENDSDSQTNQEIASIDTDNPDQNIDEVIKCSDTELDAEKYQGVHIKEEIEYESDNLSDFDETLPEETFNRDDLPPEDIYHFKNKIILGSKPSPNSNLNIQPKNTYLVVLLEDWDVHLRSSHSYCTDCKTLFTTPNALDAHRMTAHSLLAPITNRAVKSTAKSSINVTKIITAQKNIAKKSTGVGNIVISNSTYCNHCNFTFKDHTTLIKHLYKLLPVKKYSCKVCDAAFQTQAELVNHNSIHIKIEPRKILKAKTNSDNPILRNILSKDIKPIVSKAVKRGYPKEMPTPSKLVKVSANEVKKETVQSKKWWGRFKCLVCSDIFDSYGQARKHRFNHPGSVSKILFKKIPSKVKPNSKDKLTYEDESVVKNGSALAKAEFELIPKSALFQCSKCGLHFSSCIAAVSHVARGQCGDRNWTCPICKKLLRKIDENCHRKQHKLSHKFKVYNTTRNIYERVLCKCLKCGVHFDNHFLKKHISKCGKIPTTKCLRCNILLPTVKSGEHDKKHMVMKLKPKDFIHIDYAVVDDTTEVVETKKRNVDRKAIVKNTLANKKVNLEKDITIKTKLDIRQKIENRIKDEQNKVRLYYCKHCKCCLSRRNLTKPNKTHLTKKCVSRIYTSHCNICGLKLSRKSRVSHAKLHENKNLTLLDFVFYEFTNLKPITPSIPVYPSCKKCKIQFLDSNLLKNHICGEDYENCEICGKKLENSALEIHLLFHKLHQSKPNSDPKIMPELMMKYESLNAIWNILFICGKCDLVTDLYNKAIEHSQGHLNKELPQLNTIKCYICNLKFEESCWSKHSELHSRMTLDNKDFKILKYTPKNLLDESWFQMFESLPEKEIRQIIDRSVFGSERSLKMRLVKDGLPEFTVYCCNICQVAYDNNDILTHVKSKCQLPEHVCTVCDLAFDASATLHFHERLHKKGIKKEEFRIVNFDKMSKEKGAVKSQKMVKETDFKVKKLIGKDKKYTLYKCVECSICVINQKSRSVHNCAPAEHIVYCKLCNLNFPVRQTVKHNAKHKKLTDFKEKNIKVIDFEPIPKGKYKPSHRKDETTSSIHSKVKRNLKRSKSTDSDVSASSSEVKLTSSAKPKERKTLNSSKHNLLNASIDNSDTEDKKTAKIYKCECGLHYTSMKSIEKHIENCNNDEGISKENCSKCGLLFPTDILVSHLCKHHSQDTKLTVEVVHKATKRATSSNNIKLYKCGDCNVHFLNQNSVYKHTYRHDPLDPKQYIECKLCCLQFKILSLHIHMKKHHNKEFNLEKVLVEEYQPTEGKGTPKIEIYFASDKFQNLQVSSSND